MGASPARAARRRADRGRQQRPVDPDLQAQINRQQIENVVGAEQAKAAVALESLGRANQQLARYEQELLRYQQVAAEQATDLQAADADAQEMVGFLEEIIGTLTPEHKTRAQALLERLTEPADPTGEDATGQKRTAAAN